MESLPPCVCFDYETDKANAGPRWEKWLNRLENLFVGVNITNDGRKRALLLHYAGECVHDIYDAEKSSYAADTASTYSAWGAPPHVECVLQPIRRDESNSKQILHAQNKRADGSFQLSEMPSKRRTIPRRVRYRATAIGKILTVTSMTWMVKCCHK